MTLTRDLPEVVASLTSAFEQYERALVQRDLHALAGTFDASETVVRFGIEDRQYGARELARWRASQPPLPAGRALSDTVISTWGDCFGVVSTQFRYPDRPRLGRQSQTWLREGGAWRIVGAHVSEIDEAA